MSDSRYESTVQTVRAWTRPRVPVRYFLTQNQEFPDYQRPCAAV